MIMTMAQALLRFLVNGVPYAFPASLQATTRGVPTAWAAPVLSQRLVANEPPPVWPDPEGTVRGQAVKPLYPSCLLYTSPSPRDRQKSRMPSSA